MTDEATSQLGWALVVLYGVPILCGVAFLVRAYLSPARKAKRRRERVRQERIAELIDRGFDEFTAETLADRNLTKEATKTTITLIEQGIE